MAQIVQSKNLKAGTVIGSNVKVKITAMKRLRPLPPLVEGKKKPKPREQWQVEADGLGSIEVTVVIPPVTDNIKDAKVRDARIRALVVETANPYLEKLLNDHNR